MKVAYWGILAVFLGEIANAQNLIACDAKTSMPQEKMNDDGDLEAFLKPVPQNIANCDKGIRLSVANNVDLWRCRVARDDNGKSKYKTWSEALLIFKDGKNIAAYEDWVMAGGYNYFTHYEIDLNNDKIPENLVALWQSQGNGLGVNTWQLRVFDSNWQSIGKAYDAQDWGPSGLVKSPSGCDIAITSWEDDFARKKLGLAYQARFLSLKNGALVASKTQKKMRRRFTDNFDKARADFMAIEGNEHIGDPLAWLLPIAPKK